MDSKDELRKELIIGYDLCNDYSQISYFNYAIGEPKTISTAVGKEKFQIPTVLLKKQGADKWYFGEEAIKKAGSEKDALIKGLLDKCSSGETIYIEETEYEPAFLLEIFMKKSFGFLTYEGITSKIVDRIVFTVETVDRNISQALKQSAKAIGIAEENIYIQDHEESFVEYTIHQKSELWNYHVVLLEYDKDYLKAFKLKINTKTTPITATISRADFKEIKSSDIMFQEENSEEKNHKLDQLVKEKLKHYFGVSQVSCVFLSGEGFEGDWAKETLRFLCTARRVFQGKNLYTKGACYFAAKKVSSHEIDDYLFLGVNKLNYNIGIDVSYRGENQYYSLLTADENWYDANKKCELILDSESSVELKLTPIDHNDTRIVIVNLHDLPVRPNRTIRISLQVKFISENTGIVTVEDLGFGDFFESSGKIWKHEIFL